MVIFSVSESNRMQEVFDYFGVVDEQYVREREYEVFAESSQRISLDYFDNDLVFVHDGKYFIFDERSGYYYDGECANQERCVVVYDMTTGEKITEQRIYLSWLSNEDNRYYYRVNKESGHGFYSVEDNVYFIAGDFVAMYVDHQFEIIQNSGTWLGTTKAIQEDDILYVYIRDDWFTIEGNNLIPTDRFDVEYGETVKLLNGKPYLEESPYRYGYYLIDEEKYYAEELYLIGEETVVLGNFNQIYVAQGDLMREVPNGIVKNVVPCGDYFYSYWKANIIINDHPKPLLFVLDQDINIVSVSIVDYTNSYACYDGELYGIENLQKTDSNQISTYFVKYQLLEGENDVEPFSMYKTLYLSTSKYWWFLVLLPARFSKKKHDVKEKEQIDFEQNKQ
jgi:hypothetical protein